MKKLVKKLPLFLLAAMLLFAVGCGGDDQSQNGSDMAGNAAADNGSDLNGNGNGITDNDNGGNVQNGDAAIGNNGNDTVTPNTSGDITDDSGNDAVLPGTDTTAGDGLPNDADAGTGRNDRTVGDMLDDAGNAVGDVIDDAGNAVGDVTRDIGDGIRDITDNADGQNRTGAADTPAR